jgi:hypothetical protein
LINYPRKTSIYLQVHRVLQTANFIGQIAQIGLDVGLLLRGELLASVDECLEDVCQQGMFRPQHAEANDLAQEGSAYFGLELEDVLEEEHQLFLETLGMQPALKLLHLKDEGLLHKGENFSVRRRVLD